jgi:hypothetical protein
MQFRLPVRLINQPSEWSGVFARVIVDEKLYDPRYLPGIKSLLGNLPVSIVIVSGPHEPQLRYPDEPHFVSVGALAGS